MTAYILDTDTVSLFQHGQPAVCAAVGNHATDNVAISVLTVEEQLSGWYKELRRAKTARVLAAIYQRMANTVRFYSVMSILSFTEPAIARYDELARLKLRVARTDLRIAAIAMENNAVLVTRNLRDFKRFPV
jgi:tRNA(fMet)-specific endonuclease VapC